MALNRSYATEDPVYLKGKYTGSDVVFPADAPFDPGKRREPNFSDCLEAAEAITRSQP